MNSTSKHGWPWEPINGMEYYRVAMDNGDDQYENSVLIK